MQHMGKRAPLSTTHGVPTTFSSESRVRTPALVAIFFPCAPFVALPTARHKEQGGFFRSYVMKKPQELWKVCSSGKKKLGSLPPDCF